MERARNRNPQGAGSGQGGGPGRTRPARVRDGQAGQAMVEAALMLLLLSACLMFLVVSANLVQDMIKAQEHLRHDIRKAAASFAKGPFHRVDKTRRVSVEAPGGIGTALGQERIRLDLGLSSYAGAYQGYEMSEYSAYKSLRVIRE